MRDGRGVTARLSIPGHEFSASLGITALILFVYLFLMYYSQKLSPSLSFWALTIFPNLWLFLSSFFLLNRVPIGFSISRGGPKARGMSAISILLSLSIIYYYFNPSVAQSIFSIKAALKVVLIFSIVPIAEEFFFRGFLLDFLNKHMDKYFAIALVSLLFGYLHMTQGLFIHMTVLSIILCILTFFTDTLLWPIIIHMAWNALALIRNVPDSNYRLFLTIVSLSLIILLVIRGLKTSNVPAS